MMKIRLSFIIIALILLAIFAVSHLAVYFTVVKLFHLQSVFLKEALAWVLAFLGLSFFLLTLIAHIHDNVFSRACYFISATWVGLLVNLVLFFIIAWAVIFLGPKLHFASDEMLLGIGAATLAILFSIYGIWNTFHVVIRRIEVRIKNLPQKWIGKSIVQISDVHLGHIFREKHFLKIVEKINLISPEVVVITGDLFDGTDGDLDDFVEPLKSLRAPAGAYFSTGNHEIYLGIEDAQTALAKTKINWLKDSLVNIDGLQIIGIDYPLQGKGRNLSDLIPKMDGWKKTDPSVLLIHEPVQIGSAKELGISLQLSGHTHKGQLFPFSFITALIFGKYDYGFHQEGDYSIYTSSGLGGWGPPMRTQSRPEIIEITLRSDLSETIA
jgi:predicted MPP superfamily phosphohydrolase